MREERERDRKNCILWSAVAFYCHIRRAALSLLFLHAFCVLTVQIRRQCIQFRFCSGLLSCNSFFRLGIFNKAIYTNLIRALPSVRLCFLLLLLFVFVVVVAIALSHWAMFNTRRSTNTKSMCSNVRKNDHNRSVKLFGILQVCAIYSVCLSFIFLFDAVILIKFGMFHFCILSAVTAAVQQNTDALYKFSIFALHFLSKL